MGTKQSNSNIEKSHKYKLRWHTIVKFFWRSTKTSSIYHRRKVLIAVQMNYFESDAVASCSVYSHWIDDIDYFNTDLFEVKHEYQTTIPCYDITSFLFFYRRFIHFKINMHVHVVEIHEILSKGISNVLTRFHQGGYQIQL